MHPTLIALSIVLDKGEDLGRINRSHPDLEMHAFYDSNTVFPPDISDLLPPSADRWWERLGKLNVLIFSYCPLTIFLKKAEAARTEHAAHNPPPMVPKRKPRVIIHGPSEESKSSPMEVDNESDELDEPVVSVTVTSLTLVNF
jgi:hypothetical protein